MRTYRFYQRNEEVSLFRDLHSLSAARALADDLAEDVGPIDVYLLDVNEGEKLVYEI